MAKRLAAILPYFRPPRTAFGTDRSEVLGISPSEFSEEAEGALNTALYGHEVQALFRKRGGLGSPMTARRTAVYTSIPEIPEGSLVALADLVSRNWSYLQSRTIAHEAPLLEAVYPRPRLYSFTPLRQAAYTRGLGLLETSRGFRVSMLRWAAGPTRTDPLDSVLDYCSALEALFRLPDELRLRLSLSVHCVLQCRKRERACAVYEMYGIRSKFIHGGDVPDVCFDQTAGYCATIAAVLGTVVAKGALPDGQELDRKIRGMLGANLDDRCGKGS